VSQAADYMNITDKRVLVIGTETPWLEAVLLQRNPRIGITVEYGDLERFVLSSKRYNI